MAELTAYSTIAGADVADGDLFPMIDVSAATAQSPAGLNKKISKSELAIALGGGGSGLPAADDTDVIEGAADATKVGRFDVSANVPTATTVTLAFPGSDGTIATLENDQAWSGAQTFGTVMCSSVVASSNVVGAGGLFTGSVSCAAVSAATGSFSDEVSFGTNILLDADAAGTSAAGVLVIGTGTAPASRPADRVQLYSKDHAAGDARLFLLTEQGATPIEFGNGTIVGLSTPASSDAAATKGYVDTAVTGLLDFKGATDASGSPNYPAASKGDCYVVSVAGKVGGASGKSVDAGDVYVASADNAGGTEASVGTSWFVIEHNLATLGTAATQNTGTSGANVPLCNGANTWSADQVVTGKVIARQSGGVAGTDEVQIYDDGTNSIITSKNAELRLGGSSTTDRLRLTGSGVVLTDCEPDANNSRAMGNSLKSFLSMYSAAYYLATDIGMVRKAAGVFGLRGSNSTDPAGFATTPRRPSQITANQNDYSPGVGCEQEWTSDASRNVTGVVAGVDGEVRHVTNTGSNDIVLPHEDTNSAAANRWYTSTGASLTFAAKKTIRMSYSGASGLSRWKVTLLP